MQVECDPTIRDAMRAAAAGAYPDEACGLLLGERHGDRTVIRAFRTARNIAAAPRTGFAIDPLELVVSARGPLPVVGVFHSHPDAGEDEVRPSARDLAEAWPEHLLALCGATDRNATAIAFFGPDGRRYRSGAATRSTVNTSVASPGMFAPEPNLP